MSAINNIRLIRVAQIAILICASYPLIGQKKPVEYPFTVTVVRTDIFTAAPNVNSISTNCNSDGSQTDCTTRARGPSSIVTAKQVMRIGDKIEFDAVCRSGILASMGQGMAGGSGGVVHEGCNLAPGDYAARLDKNVLHLKFVDNRGKARDISFDTSPTRQANHAAATSATGTIVIASVPEGADIYVDNRFVGQTPASVALPEESHLLNIRHVKYKAWERTISIIGNSTVSISAQLEADDK